MNKCFAIGTKAEKELASILKRKGYEITWANKHQNISEHWDIKAVKGKDQFKIDVKADKKINRSDSQTQYKRVWVELINVNGDQGWLLGESDIIAFKTENGFFLIKTIELLRITAMQIGGGAYMKTRKGRKDLIVLIEMDSIIDSGKFISADSEAVSS